MKDESLLAETRRWLRQFDLRARKRLGQHFLIDRAVLQQVLAAAELATGDTVLEIVAGPGKRSLLSISVQFYGKPRVVSYVPARCFYPPPEVDSAILRLDLYAQPAVAVADEDSFFGLVRAGFSASRKQIGNSLAQGLGIPKAEVLPLLEKASIVPQRRAETLSLDEWGRLWQVFTKRENKYADRSGTS